MSKILRFAVFVVLLYNSTSLALAKEVQTSIPVISNSTNMETSATLWVLYYRFEPLGEDRDRWTPVYVSVHEDGSVIYSDFMQLNGFVARDADDQPGWKTGSYYRYKVPQGQFSQFLSDVSQLDVAHPGKGRKFVDPNAWISQVIMGLSEDDRYLQMFPEPPANLSSLGGSYIRSDGTIIDVPSNMTVQQYIDQEEQPDYRRYLDLREQLVALISSLVPENNSQSTILEGASFRFERATLTVPD